uniref:KIB1-4 beta-propeller domain-containing protein n=1 Tax=Setaria italica TaxID=4555 RepID=K3Y2T7_SETIT
MMTTARSSPWPDIQPELLGLVLRRLPSLADHVRLRALCRPWRYNARVEPLPPTTYMDGEIHHMPLLDDASCHGSMDNWLFFVHNDDGCTLMNPFSKAALQLPNLTTTWHHEMKYAYTRDSLFYKLCLSIGTGHLSWFNMLADIAFFNGKMYGLGSGKHTDTQLSVFEMNYGLDGKLKISGVECITRDLVKECLSNLGGQQALFVGKHCSKSLPAGGCTGIQEDCIYFMNGIITPLLSEGVAVPQHRGGLWRPTWLFPADDAM